MSQVMLNPIDLQADLPDTALSEYFRNAGDMLAQESALLGAVVSNILATDGHLTHKAIILQLIGVLETTDDVVMADVVRKTLEIVVDHTVDDI
ncbi:biofilm development regulator YmgB/AriR family protein [Cronobacter sakazakii]|uniref:biofilm development regulator YmgB/AriR family protein n=1 Tax=Cronobacter sakazakii TaxID=28141 RepID=UPI000CFB5245|nr:biofilm development regulator YmgB/AriR family protein [Cronobacter sakazakii]EKK5244629.1 two-component-system connector protein AriR [Cronobacter sakazakii]ELY3749443.1 two-component-system connector protein AriR [Cronobacter sakazakii]ELY4532915.1 two-component-system connector protein AriR [Cronobacter sakazakii]MBR9956951.1 two-component-system connector protein AriR [Cronobacter sakazakii]PWV34092.1 two-component-system connector protein AriR [Cronobacter sakazakii]